MLRLAWLPCEDSAVRVNPFGLFTWRYEQWIVRVQTSCRARNWMWLWHYQYNYNFVHAYGISRFVDECRRPVKSFAIYYNTGVQIVSCTLSGDSVLSESTGLFNPVLCVSQWNLFWQKNQPMRLRLSNQVRPGREWFPSPLGDFNRLFEGPIGELFKIRHWNMFYFLNDINLAPAMWICIIVCWLKQAECSVHFTIKK